MIIAMTTEEVVEFGFAFKGPMVVHGDPGSRSMHSIMEDRVIREAQRLQDQGRLKIVGKPVRTMYEGMPYVFVPVVQIKPE